MLEGQQQREATDGLAHGHPVDTFCHLETLRGILWVTGRGQSGKCASGLSFP